MYHMDEEPGWVRSPGNGHGRVTEPQGDQFSDRILGMILKGGIYLERAFFRMQTKIMSFMLVEMISKPKNI